jgi:hypothetical protein
MKAMPQKQPDPVRLLVLMTDVIRQVADQSDRDLAETLADVAADLDDRVEELRAIVERRR